MAKIKLIAFFKEETKCAKQTIAEVGDRVTITDIQTISDETSKEESTMIICTLPNGLTHGWAPIDNFLIP